MSNRGPYRPVRVASKGEGGVGESCSSRWLGYCSDVLT